MKKGLMGSSERMLDNRPSGVTGLQQAIEAKKMIQREKKVSMMEEAYIRAEVKMKILGLED
jgi:hypothetical protein